MLKLLLFKKVARKTKSNNKGKLNNEILYILTVSPEKKSKLILSTNIFFGINKFPFTCFPFVCSFPWKLFYSELSKNYEKMMLKLNFGNCKKLVLTQKPTQMLNLKFGMQGLNKQVSFHVFSICVQFSSCIDVHLYFFTFCNQTI